VSRKISLYNIILWHIGVVGVVADVIVAGVIVGVVHIRKRAYR